MVRWLTSKHLTGPCLRVRVALNHHHAIHEHGRDPVRKLVRLLVGGTIGDARCVEYHDVGGQSSSEPPTISEPEVVRGKGRHLANRFLEWDGLALSHVATERTDRIAVAARMWDAFTDDVEAAV